MINLLPPETKQGYHYARRNSRLIGWVVAFSLALVGLGILTTGGVVYLQQAAKPYHTQVADAQASLQKQDQAGTQRQAQEISNNLKLAIQVLSKEILFSQLLKQLAVITPSNASLSDLGISQVQGALDITANTADYHAATQLQVNLADAQNKIFSKADIVSITCTQPDGSDPMKARYPCTAVYRALFAPNNPFLFISDAKSTKAAKL